MEKYIHLLHKFPPRPVTSQEEFEATQTVINELIDKPELTPEEEDYLDVLGTLIYEYEQELDIIPDIYGVELLKVLLQERGLRQKDLVSIFSFSVNILTELNTGYLASA